MKKIILPICAGISVLYAFSFYLPFSDRVVVVNDTKQNLNNEYESDNPVIDSSIKDTYEEDGVVYLKGVLPEELQSTYEKVETSNEELGNFVDQVESDINDSSEGEALIQEAEALLVKTYAVINEEIPDIENIVEQELQSFDEDKHEDLRSFEDEIEADYVSVREDG